MPLGCASPLRERTRLPGSQPQSFPISQAPFDAAYLVDFVGTKTLYEDDCGDWEAASPAAAGGPRFRLSTHIACGRHDAFRAMGVGLTGIPVLGDLPIMDEEYFEWVSLLQAVDAYAEASPPRPFVVAGSGARHGTWAARSARAVRSKAPDALVDACVVAGDPTSYARMLAHLQRNVPPSMHHFFMLGVVANRSGENTAEVADKGQHQTVRTVSVADTLAKYVTVDIVHMDARIAATLRFAADGERASEPWRVPMNLFPSLPLAYLHLPPLATPPRHLPPDVPRHNSIKDSRRWTAWCATRRANPP